MPYGRDRSKLPVPDLPFLRVTGRHRHSRTGWRTTFWPAARAPVPAGQRLESHHRHRGVGPMTAGFDPGCYTTAPHQTEGVIRFAGSPEEVFAWISNHLAMTEWVPLLKTVQVSHPQPLAAGESMTGTSRVLALRGGVTVREEIVYWNPPHGYAYTTQGKRWPLRDYVGYMGVQAAAGAGGGGDYVFREYFTVDGALRRALVSPGILILGQRALHNLSQLIGGTSADFRHVPVRPAERPKPVGGSGGGG